MYYVMTTMWRALNQRGLRRVYAQSLGNIKLSTPIFGLPMLERVKEHAYKDQESTVNKHLNSCYDTNYLDHRRPNSVCSFI